MNINNQEMINLFKQKQNHLCSEINKVFMVLINCVSQYSSSTIINDFELNTKKFKSPLIFTKSEIEYSDTNIKKSI